MTLNSGALVEPGPCSALLSALVILLATSASGCHSAHSFRVDDVSHLFAVSRPKTVELARRYGFRGQSPSQAVIWASGSGRRVLVQELLEGKPGDIFVFTKGEEQPVRIARTPGRFMIFDDNASVIAHKDGAGPWVLGSETLDTKNLIADPHGRFFLRRSEPGWVVLSRFSDASKEIRVRSAVGAARPYAMQIKGDTLYLFSTAQDPDRTICSAHSLSDPEREPSRITRFEGRGRIDPWSERALVWREVLPTVWKAELLDLHSGDRRHVGPFVNRALLFLEDDWLVQRLSR